jgi:hypothetical protein
MLVAVVALAVIARAEHVARDLALEDLDGGRVEPFTSTADGWVFVFTRTDCPVAARYAPEIQRVQQRSEAAHIAFHLVFVDPSEQPASIRTYLHDYALAGHPLRDPQHRLVQASGATTTPEAAVFVPSPGGPTLVYRGRIDDRYVDVGHMRPAPTTHDLDEIISAIAGRNPVVFRSTPAVGCLIADVSR